MVIYDFYTKFGVIPSWLDRNQTRESIFRSFWVHELIHAFWRPIRGFWCYLSVSIARASSYDVARLVCVFGVEPRRLGWVLDIREDEKNFSFSGVSWQLLQVSQMQEFVGICEPRICEKGFAFAKKPDLGIARICEKSVAFATLTGFAFASPWLHLRCW